MALKETVLAFQRFEQMCPNWQNISKSCILSRQVARASNRLPGALTSLGLLPGAPGQAAGGLGAPTNDH